MAEITLDAVLPAPPPGLPWYGKILWYLAETAAAGIIYQNFEGGVAINPTAVDVADPTADEWRHVQIVIEDTVSGEAADDQAFTLDIVNHTDGVVDSSWTAADYSNVHTEVSGFCAATVSHCAGGHRYKEARYYRRAFNPYQEPKPFARGGVPEHVGPLNHTCLGGIPMPPGCCTTITEVTPSRRNWGRIYLPTINGGSISSIGRVAPSVVDALCASYAQMAANLHSKGFGLVVPTTSVGGQRNDSLRGDYEAKPVRTLQAVTEIKVDDVVDFQHRRRHRHSTYSKRNPAPAEFKDELVAG